MAYSRAWGITWAPGITLLLLCACQSCINPQASRLGCEYAWPVTSGQDATGQMKAVAPEDCTEWVNPGYYPGISWVRPRRASCCMLTDAQSLCADTSHSVRSAWWAAGYMSGMQCGSTVVTVTENRPCQIESTWRGAKLCWAKRLDLWA